MMPPRERVPLGRLVLFWSIALGGAAFDLATKSYVFTLVGEPGLKVHTLVPNVLTGRASSVGPGRVRIDRIGWSA